jgi:precorrin-2 dehydrogenase/sirohydrochlorin ferrochelatase
MSEYYPIYINLKGQKCLVVGGGEVAYRKTAALLECGAEVEVVSPALCPALNELVENHQIGVRLRDYQSGDQKEALMVIAATDQAQVNMKVAAEAKKAGRLVNVVDDPKNSTFIVPSCLKRGDISIAVSTSGRSPALARKLRLKLENELGEEYAELAVLVDEVRREVKRRAIKVDGEAWQEALNLDLLIDLIKKGQVGTARESILSRLQKSQISVKGA